MAKIMAGLAVGNALSPVDLIPDFIPVLGYLDDVLILPLMITITIRLIPEEVLNGCRIKAAVKNRDRNRFGSPDRIDLDGHDGTGDVWFLPIDPGPAADGESGFSEKACGSCTQVFNGTMGAGGDHTAEADCRGAHLPGSTGEPPISAFPVTGTDIRFLSPGPHALTYINCGYRVSWYHIRTIIAIEAYHTPPWRREMMPGGGP